MFTGVLSTPVMTSPSTRPAEAPGEPGRVPSTTAPSVVELPEPLEPGRNEPEPEPVAEESCTCTPRNPVAPMWMAELARPFSMLLATDRAVPIGMA